ncbi:hypothetical protein [Halorubrum distributum]|uniref:DUF3784 domain-containing protein n=3 Tax=Halorubrum distributum TaxID=29283 RepID=M0NXC3_9EURY|nr:MULTISPECIES: hypothetical protein [Halorubrum distributum group]ELZ33753.1 hypothetical protein C473_06735 [Halorubrum terrestre JCM 10247]EMA61235.1 hypothetical protein C470_06904 [Halorubrum litoreum JCM 13561]MYL69086.1 hypothetical protein [Halorubrum terrestre]
MALASTLLSAVPIALLLLLAWAIRYRGKVGLIAGYDGDLPPEREAELARDAARVLVVAAAATSLLIVDAWTGSVPRPDVLVTVAIVVAVTWFLYKWNVREPADD